MKAKFYLLSSVLLILLSANQCVARYSPKDLQSDYEALSGAFKKSPMPFGTKEQAQEVLETGEKIISNLINPENYVNRLATPEEKKLIIKAIITDAILFGPESFGVDRTKIGDLFKEASPYKANAEALGVTFEIAHALAVQFRDGGYAKLDASTPLQKKMMEQHPNNCQLATTHYEKNIISPQEFINCFYESLEDNYEKLSFFGRKASKKWLKDVIGQAKKEGCVVKVLTTDTPSNGEWIGPHYHCWILDDKKKPIAVYKPCKKYSCNYQEDLIPLVAKSIGMEDLVNPKIPVYIRSSLFENMRFQAEGYSGTVEPFLGYKEDDIPKDTTDFNDFTDAVLKFAINNKRTTEAYRPQQPTNPYSSLPEPVRVSDYITLDPAWLEQKLIKDFKEKDAKLLAQEETVSAEDIFKIIVLKYLMEDFSGLGKVLFDVDFTLQKIKPVLCGDEIKDVSEWHNKSVPGVYKMVQAGTLLEASTMQRILNNISVESLQDIRVAFDVRGREKISKISERLTKIKNYCSYPRTTRDVTHELWGRALGPAAYSQPTDSSFAVIKALGKNSRNDPALKKWVFSFSEEEYGEWAETLEALYLNIN